MSFPVSAPARSAARWLIAALAVEVLAISGCAGGEGGKQAPPQSPVPAASAAAQPGAEGGAMAADGIGSALMQPDGTLELRLESSDGQGAAGDTLMKLTPGSPDYQRWLKHIGGLAPGETKRIPAFRE